MGRIKQLIIGKPLENEALKEEKYSVAWGLPILSSDAISSVAYATEEILLVLVPAIGILAYHQMTYISAAIVFLLVLLTVSYRQTIQNYPNGGGSYIVSSDNLGKYAGVVAGSALLIDYTLTAAVSISSGTYNIASAFPALMPHRVSISLAILLLILIGNLRGIKESAKMFGLPAYAFMFAIASMIVSGIVKVKVFGYIPPEPPQEIAKQFEPVTLLLILRAFSSGCTALTGVEAVSNAVPNFKEPPIKHAQKVLFLLSLVVFVLFGGISLLSNMYHVLPTGEKSVLAQINQQIFGTGFMFYFIQFTTMIILAMAANTAYAGFPMLLSVMARDGFAPRQFSQRGERLNFSNGILTLTLMAAALILVFKAEVTLLIPLYAVGVFISFTLSQTGMFFKLVRSKQKGWYYKAMINGVGALVTFTTVLIIGATKFIHGAWIVILVIPLLVIAMLKIKSHYIAVAEQLRLSSKEIEELDLTRPSYRNHAIVPIDSINRASVRALRYARTISDSVIAFHVSIDEADMKKIQEKWSALKTDIPLIVKYSTYRKVVQPLLDFVESEEHAYKKGDIITVILPEFSVNTWWHIFLHNKTRLVISRKLLKHKHIVVSAMPLQLKNDKSVLKHGS